MDVINRNSVDAFITKDKSEIREIMSPANSEIKRQSLAEAIVQPGESTDLHIHRNSEEIYYVLSGTGSMFHGGESRTIAPGDAVANPPGVPHKVINDGDEPLVFLCMCVPRYTHDDTELLEEE